MTDLIELFRESTAEWKENLSSEDYHDNKAFVNSGSLKLMLKSPASFHANFVWGEKPPPNDAMRIGSAVHLAILDSAKFKEAYVIQPEFGDMRSPKNRVLRDEWRSGLPLDQIIVTQPELEMMERIANNIVKHKDAFNLLKNGKTEISGFYRDRETGICCKIRPDFLNFDLGALVDLKTTQDCSRIAFAKSVWNYRYDFQMAMYSDGIKHISGKPVDFVAFIAVEKTPPFEVAVYVADDGLMDKGEQDYRRALKNLKECIEKKEWSSYQTQIENISLPAWAFFEE